MFFPAFGNLTPTNAKAVGLAISYNDVRGDTSAEIKNAEVTATTGDIAVRATGKGTIDAYGSSTVSASGGSGINGEGKVASYSGQIVTNVVLGDTTAGVSNSTLVAGDDIDVVAVNSTQIDARLYSVGTSSGGTAGSVTIAHNTVGWDSQNILFNTIDTIVGAPYIADNGFDGNVGSNAKAFISKSAVDAGGKLTVNADNDVGINATVSNAASTESSALYGAKGAAYGVVIAGNKVSGTADAKIDNTNASALMIEADDGVSVIASDAAHIFSNAKLVVESTVTSDGGLGIAQETLNDLYNADYDNKPDEGGHKYRNIQFGDRVRIADDFIGDVAIDLGLALPPTQFPIKMGDYVKSQDVERRRRPDLPLSGR